MSAAKLDWDGMQDVRRRRYAESLVLVAGAFLISLALDYGLGVSFGWWGLAFWPGFGLICAYLRASR